MSWFCHFISQHFFTWADFLEAVAVARQAAPAGKFPVAENTEMKKNMWHLTASSVQLKDILYAKSRDTAL